MSYIVHAPTKQLDIEEHQERAKRLVQRACLHRFYDTTILDSENDRVLDLSECVHCGLQR